MPVKKVQSSKLKVKSEKKVEKTVQTKVPKVSGLSVPVYSLTGKTSGALLLPKEIFGQKVNEKLLAQAQRVYSTNQKTLPGSTKTRGEVRGSTAKIFRQKGTGRARHGAIRAPIFVGGGIVFGPKPRMKRLELTQKMKRAALLSAFSARADDKNILGVSGLEKATGKTKEMAKLVNSLSFIVNGKDKEKKQKQISTLIITAEKMDNMVRAVRNIPGIDVIPANLVNAYEVLGHEYLMITKETIEKLAERFKRV